MTNKEMLRRLKDAFVGETVNYFYAQKFSRVELDGKKYKELIEELMKDAQYDEYMKMTLNSVYGVGGVAKPYCERDVELIQKVCELYINDLYPSRALFVDSGDWKKLYKYSIRDFDTEELKGFAKMFTRVNVLTKNEIVKAFNYNTPKVMFNEPATILQWGDFKTVVKCDEEDNFSRLIGLGIALYRYYRQHKDHKKQFNVLANGYMDLERLAYYALDYFTKFEKSNFKKLFGLIKHGEEGTWIKLDI